MLLPARTTRVPPQATVFGAGATSEAIAAATVGAARRRSMRAVVGGQRSSKASADRVVWRPGIAGLARFPLNQT